MKRRRVVFTKTAHEHIRSARAWWVDNSLDLDIFLAEIDDALGLVSLLPGAGAVYNLADVEGLRRIYLRRLTSHL